MGGLFVLEIFGEKNSWPSPLLEWINARPFTMENNVDDLSKLKVKIDKMDKI